MDRKYASRLSGEGQVVPSEQRPAQHSSSARVQLLPRYSEHSRELQEPCSGGSALKVNFEQQSGRCGGDTGRPHLEGLCRRMMCP